MVGFPKVIKTKADLVNTYKLVKKGRLKKEDWLAAVEKLENQNFIFCHILEKTEDRKGVTLMFVNEVTEGERAAGAPASNGAAQPPRPERSYRRRPPRNSPCGLRGLR